MSEIAKFSSNAATKFQIGVAACAVAAAATLTPVVAKADVTSVAPLAPVSHIVETTLQGPAQFVAHDVLKLGGNAWWWFGTPNPNPPPKILAGSFAPLWLLPGFLRQPWMNLTKNIKFEACILGLGFRIGPYGTLTISFGRGC